MAWLSETTKKYIPAALVLAVIGGGAMPPLSGPSFWPTHVNYMTRQTPCRGTVASKEEHPGGWCGTPYTGSYYRFGVPHFSSYGY